MELRFIKAKGGPANTGGTARYLKKATGPDLGLVGLDVGHHVGNRLELLSVLVGNFHGELILESHHEFDGVKGVSTKIFDELSIGGHFFGINAELSSDDFFYLGFDIVGHKIDKFYRCPYSSAFIRSLQQKKLKRTQKNFSKGNMGNLRNAF